MLVAESPPRPARQRLVARVDPRASGAPVTWIIAPAGYGKTTLLAELLAVGVPATAPAVHVSLLACEAHLGLFVDALARELRRVGAAIGLRPLGAPGAGDAGDSWLCAALGEALAEGGGAGLVLLLDDAQALRRDEPLTRMLTALVVAPPPGVSIVVAARERPPLGALTGVHVDRRDLELTEAEVEEVLAAQLPGGDPALARRVFAQTGGWPAVVSLFAAAAAGPAGPAALVDQLARGDGELVAGVVALLLAPLRPEARYFADVAALFERFDLPLMEAIFSPDVPGTPEARRRLIRLSPRALSDAVAQLGEVQALVPVSGGGLALHPVCRATLAEGLRARDPDAFREAHRRAAEVLRARGDDGPAPYDHLVAAEAYERLLELLADRAEGFFAGGDHAALGRWLAALVAHYATAPFWVDYYLGRVAADRGDWELARARLDEARSALEGGRAEGAEAWRWQPRLAIGYATLLWRRGALSEARTWAQRGADFIEQQVRRGRVPDGAQAEVAGAAVELAALLGRIAMDAGGADKAREALTEALGGARAAGAAALEAQILADLALTAARVGDLEAATAARDAGLARADEGAFGVRAALWAARAWALVPYGRAAEAAAEAAQARALAERSGEVGALALAWGAVARAAQARGRHGEAREAFAAAVEHAQRAARVGLHAESLDRLAMATLRGDTGQVPVAAQHHETAEHVLAPMAKLEGHILAVHKEAAAELRLARDASPRGGLLYLEAARDGYDRFGANYDVARLHWRQAEVHHAQAEAGDADAREEAIAQLEDACVVLDEHGLVLEDEPSRQVLALIGARVGEDEMRRYCEGIIGRLGVDPGVELAGPVRATVQAYGSSRAAVAVGGAPYRVTTRDGAAPLEQEGYDALVADGGPALVALVAEQALLNFGKRVDLAQKRVMFPLLLTLLRSPSDPFSMRELAEAVWGTDAFDATTQTKVKVAISRLRALLGKGRKYIVTTRVGDGDGDDEAGDDSVVAYQVAPNLAFKIVETT